jgi:hypothetical protein
MPETGFIFFTVVEFLGVLLPLVLVGVTIRWQLLSKQPFLTLFAAALVDVLSKWKWHYAGDVTTDMLFFFVISSLYAFAVLSEWRTHKFFYVVSVFAVAFFSVSFTVLVLKDFFVSRLLCSTSLLVLSLLSISILSLNTTKLIYYHLNFWVCGGLLFLSSSEIFVYILSQHDDVTGRADANSGLISLAKCIQYIFFVTGLRISYLTGRDVDSGKQNGGDGN